MATPGRRPAAPLASRSHSLLVRAGKGLAILWLGVLAAAPAFAFDLKDVATRAHDLAARDYEPPDNMVPRWLREISYDQWRDIRFRTANSLWHDTKSLFQVQFFHPGLYYDRTIKVNQIVDGKVVPVPFTPSDFDYGKNDFASRVPQNMGFAGFRIHYPLKKPTYMDELVVFVGASYFRALARDSVYGLSARGLAIDTAEPRGEEFPWFREFWLERPAAGQKHVVLYALLDSPSVAGAYRMDITPGVTTGIDVEAEIYGRKDVGKLGVAPLTSMFFHGELTQRKFDDFRPEVHDSDGLALHMGHGEWIWRPIDNRNELQVSSFGAPGLKGFGLLQRDRNFDHYQDLEVVHELRPGVWIEPREGFEAGRVELVEIPTDDEKHDNIVTAFIPDKQLRRGDHMRFAYHMLWESDGAPGPPTGRVVATRRDSGTYEDGVRMLVDFSGGELAKLGPDEILQGVVTLHDIQGKRIEPLEQRVERVPAIQGYRLVFQLQPDGVPVEMRAFLKKGDDALTETWSYLMVP